MKILYVTALNETINAFLIPHIERLIELGNEVHCACNINREINPRLSNKNVIYHSIKFTRNPLTINYLNVIKEIRRIYKLNNYDIVHVHTPIAAFLTRFALRNENVKIIYTAHGFHFFKGAPIINWMMYYPLEKIAANWTDRLITINNEDFDRAKSFKLRNNGQLMLMHGVGINSNEYEIENFNRDEYRKNLGVNKDDFMMLILADLNKNKNHINVIKSIKELNDDNIKIICAGAGPLKDKLVAKLDALKLEKNIQFVGFRKDVKELINSSDCVGLFSKREGLPKSLMEAMCCGRPIIASNIRGCKDMISNDDIGVIVNSSDYNNIADGLSRMRKKKYNSEKIKENVNKYDINKVLDEIEVIHQI